MSAVRAVASMKRVLAIRQRREAFHIHSRLLRGVELRKAADIREVQQNMNLLRATNGIILST